MHKILAVLLYFSFISLGGCTNGKDTSENNTSEIESQANEIQENDQQKTLVFFGNSLTAGYGLDPEDAFPYLIEQKLDSLGKDYKVINAGLSGETTAAGLSRVDWILDQYDIDVFVLELGGNDGLRGIDLEETKSNLEKIIEKVRAEEDDVEIILAGMQIPPNMGPDYTSEFRNIFPEVAEDKDVSLIPFLLENVGGEKELNLGDGIHPNEKGHKIVAENVWRVLKQSV